MNSSCGWCSPAPKNKISVVQSAGPLCFLWWNKSLIQLHRNTETIICTFSTVLHAYNYCTGHEASCNPGARVNVNSTGVLTQANEMENRSISCISRMPSPSHCTEEIYLLLYRIYMYVHVPTMYVVESMYAATWNLHTIFIEDLSTLVWYQLCLIPGSASPQANKCTWKTLLICHLYRSINPVHYTY